MEIMSKLKDDEQVWYQLVIRPTGEDFKKEGEKKINQIFDIESSKKRRAGSFPEFGLGVTLGEVVRAPFEHPGSGGARKKRRSRIRCGLLLRRARKDMTEAIEEKISKIAFEATPRFLFLTKQGNPDPGIIAALHGFVRQFNTQNLNSLKPNSVKTTASYAVRGMFKKTRIRWRKRIIYEDYRNISPSDKKSVLNIEELATIYHFPIAAVSTTELEKIPSRKGQPAGRRADDRGRVSMRVCGIHKPFISGFRIPRIISCYIKYDGRNSDLTPLGYYNFRHQQKKFGIKIDDRRRHIYIIGKTGVGKTTLLENMAIADIRSGKGVAIVDPHGEFAEKMLDFVPEERLDDVIYFDPSDMEYPIAFNPMEQVGTEYRHLVASGLMGVFKKIWADAWSARMQYILNNTLLALLENPGATLLGHLRMFSNPDYRKQIVDNLRDPVIKAFWQDEFSKYSQRFETEALAAIQNKVGQFVSNPLVRNILGQPHSSLNMRDIMDSGKIFICNLSKGKIGEDNSALLGAMIITRLQLAAMSRVDLPEEKRRDFFLYVDEFQNFATESFANILSEARKYRLSLVLAHQYIGQLRTGDSTMVRDAVFGNVGTIIAFRVGAEDAEFLEKEFMPEFLQNDLVNLSKANIYIKLMIDGVASRPFSAETMPPQKDTARIVSRRDPQEFARPLRDAEGRR